MSADAPPSSFYFAVVSSKDSPLYELESAAVYQQQQGSGEGVMSPNKTSAAAVAPVYSRAVASATRCIMSPCLSSWTF